MRRPATFTIEDRQLEWLRSFSVASGVPMSRVVERALAHFRVDVDGPYLDAIARLDAARAEVALAEAAVAEVGRG